MIMDDDIDTNSSFNIPNSTTHMYKLVKPYVDQSYTWFFFFYFLVKLCILGAFRTIAELLSK